MCAARIRVWDGVTSERRSFVSYAGASMIPIKVKMVRTIQERFGVTLSWRKATRMMEADLMMMES